MGEIMSLLSGISLAGSSVSTRKGVFHARESFSALPISIAVGIILTFIVLLITGRMGQLAHLNLLGIVSFGGAGVVHYLIGRRSTYIGLRLIGANRMEPLLATNMIIAISFGLFFLDETLTLYHILGISAVFGGVILIGTSVEGFSKGVTIDRSTLLKGLASGLFAGLCYGMSPLLVKIGLLQLDDALVGTFVSHIAAGLIVMLFFVKHEHRSQIVSLNSKAMIPIIIGSILLALGQILRYIAFGLSPINIVTPLTATNNLFVPAFSYLFNRKMESFSPRVLGGAFAVIAGIYIIMLS